MKTVPPILFVFACMDFPPNQKICVSFWIYMGVRKIPKGSENGASGSTKIFFVFGIFD